MQLLIQNPQNGKFLKDLREWVSKEDEARFFSNAISLLNFCHTHGLKDVDIVIQDPQKPRPVKGKVPFQTIMV